MQRDPPQIKTQEDGVESFVVDVSDSMFDFKQTFVFEWCMVECEFENGHQRELCWKEIGL